MEHIDAAAAPAAEISIRGLRVQYGSVTAVDDVSLDVHAGEMLVLLGPSGSGKTSTMRTIVGLEQPAAGIIEVAGQTLFDSQRGINVPVHKRGIGMVFQSYAIWPHMTVYQNVAFPLRMQKASKGEIRDIVDQVLERVGLQHLATRSASRLSGGQMQRVALARSLAMNPKVLLLDEPLSNLDARLRERLRFELKELQQSVGVTSVYVTHDQAEAIVLADRIVVMNEGRIVQEGPPNEVYNNPSSRFVADFLGVSNLYAATVTDVVDGLSVVAVADRIRLRSADQVKPGQEVTVCVRPDAVRMDEGVGAETIPGTLQGTVAAVNFVGTHFRYKVDLDGGLTCDVVRYGQQAEFDRGDVVRLRIEPKDVRLLEH